MNSEDVNDRKQKLSNIIKKITESQLLKIKEADKSACNRQDCKINMNPQGRDNETNKAMPTKGLNEKGHFEGPGFNAEPVGSSSELPEALPKPVGPGVNL